MDSFTNREMSGYRLYFARKNAGEILDAENNRVMPALDALPGDTVSQEVIDLTVDQIKQRGPYGGSMADSEPQGQTIPIADNKLQFPSERAPWERMRLFSITPVQVGKEREYVFGEIGITPQSGMLFQARMVVQGTWQVDLQGDGVKDVVKDESKLNIVLASVVGYIQDDLGDKVNRVILAQDDVPEEQTEETPAEDTKNITTEDGNLTDEGSATAVGDEVALDEMKDQMETTRTKGVVQKMNTTDRMIYEEHMKAMSASLDSGDLAGAQYNFDLASKLMEKYLSPNGDTVKEPVIESSSLVARLYEGRNVLGASDRPLVAESSKALLAALGKVNARIASASIGGIERDTWTPVEVLEGTVLWHVGLKYASSDIAKIATLKVTTAGDKTEVVEVFHDVYGTPYPLTKEGVREFLGSDMTDKLNALVNRHLKDEKEFGSSVVTTISDVNDSASRVSPFMLF